VLVVATAETIVVEAGMVEVADVGTSAIPVTLVMSPTGAPLPPPDAGDELTEGPEPLQTVAEGVMTFVTVPAPEYASDMEEADPVQGLLVTSVVISDEIWFSDGDETVSEEPDASVAEKLLLLTTMD
jgi:hypothetical protein